MSDYRDIAGRNPKDYSRVFVGPYATFYTPAKGVVPTDPERAFVNLVGLDHTGGKGGIMNADHQPPTSLNIYGEKQYIYPQSRKNSNRQGAEVQRLLDHAEVIAEQRVKTELTRQNLAGGALALAFALDSLRTQLGDYFNRRAIEEALAQCQQQKGYVTTGCGCCRITIFKMWEVPARSSRNWFTPGYTITPPQGQSWVLNAYGDYAPGDCSKHPRRGVPTLYDSYNGSVSSDDAFISF